MCRRQGHQPVLKGLPRLAGNAPECLIGHGLHHGERILDAMVELGQQQLALRIGALTFADIDVDADHAE